MGHKVNPIGFRVGITRKPLSRWYADKKHFGTYLVQDVKIRTYVKKNFGFAGISCVEIERTEDEVEVTLFAARPGVVIGRHGSEIDRLREDLTKITDRKVNVRIQEVHKPDLDGQLVSENIAEQLEKRISTRRAMKKVADACVMAGALGIKIKCSGRLGGAEIARCEDVRIGSVPCQKLRADISYGFAEAHTTMGTIGIKVWIYRGDIEDTEA